MPADGPAIAALEAALRVLGPDAAPDEMPEADAGPATPTAAAEAAGGAGAGEAATGGPSATESPEAEVARRAAVQAALGVLLGLDAERQVDAGDGPGAAAAWLRAAAAHRAEGHLDAALDACYLALALTPDDPGLHFTLAEIYLERGWRAHAVDKLLLLARLADLESDTATREATRERLCAIASEQLADEARLVEVCS